MISSQPLLAAVKGPESPGTCPRIGPGKQSVVVCSNADCVRVQLYVWRENDQVVRRCRWTVPRPSLNVDHFDLSADFLAVISTDGQAFTGSIPVADCTQSSSQDSPRPGQTVIVLSLLPHVTIFQGGSVAEWL